MDKATALPQIAAAAVAASASTGCPDSLLAAQCIIESGWLNHAPGNNCFGIKFYSGCLGAQILATKEWFSDVEVKAFLAEGGGRTAALVEPKLPARKADGRRHYNIADIFATFATLADCFTKRAGFWDAGPYAAAAAACKASGDVAAYVKAIAPVYATDPRYAGIVIAVMNSKDVVAALVAARAKKGA